MQKQTPTKQSAQLNIQENAENNHKENSPLIEREEIQGTPFTLIKLNEEYFMVMGDYAITNKTNTRQEQIEKLDNEKWKITTTVIQITIHRILELDHNMKPTRPIFKEEPYETESL